MKKKNLMLLITMSLTIGLFCCGGDEEPEAAGDCNVAYTTFLADEFTAYSNAGLAWSQDPTNLDKCKDYRIAAESLIDKYIDAYKDCGLDNYDQVKSAWETQLALLKQSCP